MLGARRRNAGNLLTNFAGAGALTDRRRAAPFSLVSVLFLPSPVGTDTPGVPDDSTTVSLASPVCNKLLSCASCERMARGSGMVCCLDNADDDLAITVVDGVGGATPAVLARGVVARRAMLLGVPPPLMHRG